MNIADEIERLATFEFFNNVGKADLVSIGSLTLTIVRSWRESVKIRGSNSASNAFLEASNRLTERLSSGYRVEYRRWNIIADENRSLLEAQLLPKLDREIDNMLSVKEIPGGCNLIKSSVRWDLMHYAAELAYSAFVAPSFFSQLIKVYELGHFPCNWDEKWPDGTILYY